MLRFDDHKEITMDFSNLTPEQQEKVRGCKTTEEMLALAKEEGCELTEDELEQMSGGWGSRKEYQEQTRNVRNV